MVAVIAIVGRLAPFAPFAKSHVAEMAVAGPWERLQTTTARALRRVLWAHHGPTALAMEGGG
ncbi:hypothetical protein PISMIDRAFT_20297 [Pisolithus microcarpus 441]|uniref:Uncharacterized protein n=1 Tax=Pisolithus microcarpus 441 TaxID=765257 RepID=A0A0C9Y976_9AGAM|nr:hypothetical protein PISMIDRAFT_20297 [Pisolithus microcarpus 441]